MNPERKVGSIVGHWEILEIFDHRGFIECCCIRCGGVNILTGWVLARKDPIECRICEKKHKRRENSAAGRILGRWKVMCLAYPKHYGVDYSKRWYLTQCILCGYQRHQRPDQLEKNLGCIECRHTF